MRLGSARNLLLCEIDASFHFGVTVNANLIRPSIRQQVFAFNALPRRHASENEKKRKINEK
jgi:hypothetical protein